MIGGPNEERLILPRWLPYVEASQQKILATKGDSIWKPNAHSLAQFEFLKEEWAKSQSLTVAADLVGCALVLQCHEDPKAVMAAEQLLSTSEARLALPRAIAVSILGRRETLSIQTESKTQVSLLRQQLKMYPNNALAWLDMAYFYTLVGEPEKAEKCIRAALTLGANNTFIIRSAARFFLHNDDCDQALFHLRRHPHLKHDPWVLAPAIAIADALGHTMAEHKSAFTILASHPEKTREVTELAAALATREFKEGNSRDAKKLIRRALGKPNENSLAQAVWLAPHLRLDKAEFGIVVPNQFEADARDQNERGDYKEALDSCKKWQHFQPFSSTPAVFGSFVASVFLDAHEEALALIDNALPSSKYEFTLHNNKAFSLAKLGRVEDASQSFLIAATLATDEENSAIVKATEGLIEYRKGNTFLGRILYREAIEELRAANKPQLVNLGLFFWAQEEARIENGPITEDDLLLAVNSYGEDKAEWKALQKTLFDLPLVSTGV